MVSSSGGPKLLICLTAASPEASWPQWHALPLRGSATGRGSPPRLHPPRRGSAESAPAACPRGRCELSWHPLSGIGRLKELSGKPCGEITDGAGHRGHGSSFCTLTTGEMAEGAD